MAALSALLKTWVILQTLCLALAQVVSGRGRLGPAQFGICFCILGFSGNRIPWKGPAGSKCLKLVFSIVCCFVCWLRHCLYSIHVQENRSFK